ncbi:alanine racemase [Microbacterium murale]|uniref:D-serine deaminase-like pyridoxal phosphate-dependent protein n=1 Tax=Microbacterium murale TaxID=1081040 RepID=A0ABU0P6Q3_9MICO|nr:alanine racemase [Microbacterium murale]MDQ0643013.1 D-serine deaminase-like pyridoxal phosphate-dependent protein [Microbacterium murale]
MNEIAEIRLTARHKGLPERAVGMTTAEFLASGPRLSEFWTPLVVLDDTAMRHNVEVMANWCAERGLELMPHGKTTMAPALWQRQMDAGSLGITLATMGQVRTARTFGVSSIMLANAAVDAHSLRYLAGELADIEFRFVCWADSIATVEAMEAPLRDAAAQRKVDVLVELGGEGGRTGARTIDEAIKIAERIAASDVLRLAGVAGYEGSLAHDRSVRAIDAVETYLRRQVELHEGISHLYDGGDVYVTAGGSAYFDLVAEVFAEAGAAADAAERPGGGRTLFTLRSGAYIVHDDGFYRGISPFDEARMSDDEPRFVPGMFGVGRVVSHPEPGLALIDGGKRDFPFDEGLPIPRAMSSQLGAAWQPLPGASISAMNDQHSYVRLEDGGNLAIGDLVRLGLSHPCTAFDKWTVLPVVESVDSDVVVDLIHTFF